MVPRVAGADSVGYRWGGSQPVPLSVLLGGHLSGYRCCCQAFCFSDPGRSRWDLSAGFNRSANTILLDAYPVIKQAVMLCNWCASCHVAVLLSSVYFCVVLGVLMVAPLEKIQGLLLALAPSGCVALGGVHLAMLHPACQPLAFIATG